MTIFLQMVEAVDILGDGPPEGCEGSSMKGDVFFSGKVRFAKEQWHVSYVFTSLKSATSSIEDRWIGIKFIVYNFQENSKTVVKTELWLDKNNNGNFVKVDEKVDRGGWGTEVQNVAEHRIKLLVGVDQLPLLDGILQLMLILNF